MSAFHEIFNIQLYHSFYEDSSCYGLKIIPDKYTESILKNSKAIYRNQPNGIRISQDSGFISALKAFRDENAYLLFKVFLKDNYFYNYTDILHKQDRIFFFDSSTATKKENERILTRTDEVSEEDQVNLSSFKYSSSLSKEEINVPLFGIIKVGLKDILSENYNPEMHKPINLSIRFRAKSTYWRYNFIDSNNNQFDELYIIDNNKKVSFETFKRLTLSNGQDFGQITSSQPISHHEKSRNHFRLLGKKDKQEKLILNKLSIPNYKHLIKENNKIITETYVYY